MESIQEVLEKANIVRDSKARRVLNTAPDKDSGITLAEIQNGVSIERLESLDVPVYVYGGQVTIHGTFKDDVKDLRVAGYKSIFKNGNGSLGVKYVGIDGTKKRKLVDISNLKTVWYVNIDSKGCQAYRSFVSKAEAIECYKSAPTCYIGTKTAFAGVFGNYYVVLDIGAVYDSEFWNLVLALTGLTKEEAMALEAKRQEEKAIQEAKWEKESQERIANSEIKKAENKAWRSEMNALLAQKFEETSYKGFGTYLYPYASSFYEDKKGFYLVKIEKGSFGRKMEKHFLFKNIEDIDVAKLEGQKSKVVGDSFEMAISKIKLFKI